MEFYWGYTNPNFFPKICSKEVWENPLKNEAKTPLIARENAKSLKAPTWHDRAGTHGCPCIGPRVAVHPRTAVRGTHEWPSTKARPCVHTQLSVRLVARLGMFLPGAHSRAPLWHARALSYCPQHRYSWRLGLRRTSNLPWNRSWTLLL